MAVPASEKETVSQEIRKISNGYVIRTSHYDEKGNYNSREVYSPTKPALPGVPKQPAKTPTIRRGRK